MICANRDIPSSLRSTTVTTEAKLELWSSWLLIVVDFLEDLFRNLVSHKLLIVRYVSLSFFLHSLRCLFDEKINIFFFISGEKPDPESVFQLPPTSTLCTTSSQTDSCPIIDTENMTSHVITTPNQTPVNQVLGTPQVFCNLGYLQRHVHFFFIMDYLISNSNIGM